MNETAQRDCVYCRTKTHQSVWVLVMASGAEHYGWRCSACKGWPPSKDGGQWIAKEKLIQHSVDFSILPIEKRETPRCAKCGVRGAEEHHWAPRAMFGRDIADLWPKDYLCKSCHDEWHRVVTPALVQRKAS